MRVENNWIISVKLCLKYSVTKRAHEINLLLYRACILKLIVP